MSKHSATPWQLCHHLTSAEKDASCKCGYRGGIWGDAGELLVCEMRNCDQHEGHDMTPVGDRATQLANAAFIVKAVNSHDALVMTLEAIANSDRTRPDWKVLEEMRTLARLQLRCLEDQDHITSAVGPAGDRP